MTGGVSVRDVDVSLASIFLKFGLETERILRASTPIKIADLDSWIIWIAHVHAFDSQHN